MRSIVACVTATVSLATRVTGRGMVYRPNRITVNGRAGLSDLNDGDSILLTSLRESVPLEGLDGSGWLRGEFVDVSNRIPRFVTDEIERLGYQVKRSYQSYAFAGVHGIKQDSGILTGGADPQRDGMALLV